MIDWTDALGIGIPEIDDQHRTFIGLLNRLSTMSAAPDVGRPELRLILADLVTYAEHHFIDEEQHMHRTGYPGVAEHQAKHDAAAAKIHDLLVKEAEEAELYRFLGEFLNAWLVNHIMGEDKAYGEWLAEPTRATVRLTRP